MQLTAKQSTNMIGIDRRRRSQKKSMDRFACFVYWCELGRPVSVGWTKRSICFFFRGCVAHTKQHEQNMRTGSATIEHGCVFGVLAMLAVQLWLAHRRLGGPSGRWAVVVVSAAMVLAAVVAASWTTTTTTRGPANLALPAATATTNPNTIIATWAAVMLARKLRDERKVSSVLEALTADLPDTAPSTGHLVPFMCSKLNARARFVGCGLLRQKGSTGFVWLIRVDTKIDSIAKEAHFFLSQAHIRQKTEILDLNTSTIEEVCRNHRQSAPENAARNIFETAVLTGCMRFVAEHKGAEGGKIMLVVAIGDPARQTEVVDACRVGLPYSLSLHDDKSSYMIVGVSDTAFAQPSDRPPRVYWATPESVRNYMHNEEWKDAHVFLLYSDFEQTNMVQRIFGTVKHLSPVEYAFVFAVDQSSPRDLGLTIQRESLGDPHGHG